MKRIMMQNSSGAVKQWFQVDDNNEVVSHFEDEGAGKKARKWFIGKNWDDVQKKYHKMGYLVVSKGAGPRYEAKGFKPIDVAFLQHGYSYLLKEDKYTSYLDSLGADDYDDVDLAKMLAKKFGIPSRKAQEIVGKWAYSGPMGGFSEGRISEDVSFAPSQFKEGDIIKNKKTGTVYKVGKQYPTYSLVSREDAEGGPYQPVIRMRRHEEGQFIGKSKSEVAPEEEIGKAKASDDAQDYISKKIKILRDEGYPEKQAIAIAYSYARKKGYKV